MQHEFYMQAAIGQAKYGITQGEPPFGCVVVSPDNQIVVRQHDQVNADGDMSSHAETLAVRKACRLIQSDLEGYTLYTTVEPCAMCFTTAWLNHVSRIVYGATMAEVDAMTQGQQREMPIPSQEMNARSGNMVELVGGILKQECLRLFETYTYATAIPGQTNE